MTGHEQLMVANEPDLKTAYGWWSELPAKWTPVGWKDHLFRFNVLYNGMISAVPDLNPRTKRWQGQGMQLGVYPSDKAEFPGHVSDPQDNGSVVQGWNDCSTPVLWSEWARDGITFRSEIFGHIPDTGEVDTGSEPLFAWVRLSIHDILPGLPAPEFYGFNLLINAPYIFTGSMSIRYNIAVDRSKSAYPRKLVAESPSYSRSNGMRILEPDGKVRLAVAPGQDVEVQALPDTPTELDYLLFVPLKIEKGSRVDLLVPMLPTERELFDEELMVGYDGALAKSNGFWSRTPDTAVVFDTPEAGINEAIRASVKLSELIAEKTPKHGWHVLLTGSWTYADVWSTPAATQCAMLLDPMGHHAAAQKYLRMYVEDQGSVVAEGDYFSPHPGSLGPPTSVAACTWTADHGAILWALANSALMSGDQTFVDYVTEPVVKACEYVQHLRRVTGHGGVDGLMPPGVATDMPTRIQSVWADGWAYKGLTTAVRFLTVTGHPRAEEFAREAADYRTTFVDALRAVSMRMPQWTDDDGGEHRLVPLAVYGAQPFEYRNAFYLDTGPLFLVFTGLLDVEDEMMISTLRWFREGPPTRTYRYDSDCWQVPALHREMSSCEPCYSWNVFHSHRSGDRAHYLEGMYSLYAGAISRQTYTACETRGGVTGVIGAAVPVYLARLAVVDDQISRDQLHLLRMMPLAWLSEERESVFQNMPTEFGPVDLRVRLSGGGSEMRVSLAQRFRTRPASVVLHVPPVDGLERVTVNGEQVEWDRDRRTVSIGA